MLVALQCCWWTRPASLCRLRTDALLALLICKSSRRSRSGKSPLSLDKVGLGLDLITFSVCGILNFIHTSGMPQGMGMLVCWSTTLVQTRISWQLLNGLPWNIVLLLNCDIHGPQRMNPDNFAHPLTSSPVSPWGLRFWVKCLFMIPSGWTVKTLGFIAESSAHTKDYTFSSPFCWILEGAI